MEAERRRSRVRNPLSDCTNTVNSSQSSSSSSATTLSRIGKSRKAALSSAITKLLYDAKSTKPAAGSNDAGGTVTGSLPPIESTPPPVESTPPRPPPRPSSPLGKDEPCSVYTRRQSAVKPNSVVRSTKDLLSNIVTSEKRKGKGKAVDLDGPLSCPPAMKIQKIGAGSIKDDVGNNIPKVCTTLQKKKQGRKKSRKDSDKLSQDYIEQQRAYFAEIDAFELSEEEVETVSDLD